MPAAPSIFFCKSAARDVFAEKPQKELSHVAEKWKPIPLIKNKSEFID